MTFTRVKVNWAKKLLRAKYFVAMTDKASVIALDAADPEDFTDLMALSAQMAEVEAFQEQLSEFVERHKQAIQKLTGVKSEKPKRVRRPVQKQAQAKAKASTRGERQS